MHRKDTRIDEYIAKATDFARPILTHIREIIHIACPEVEETWKWSFPHFMYNGAILCSMASFKNHCAFSLWKAELLEDKANILTLHNRESMGHLGKIELLSDLPEDKILIEYIKAGMELNEKGVKRPVKKKALEKEKGTIEMPEYFAEELKKHDKAKTGLNALSSYHQREYIEWLQEAKTDATRNKRMAQAIEWLEEGKSRNWKYMKQ